MQWAKQALPVYLDLCNETLVSFPPPGCASGDLAQIFFPHKAKVCVVALLPVCVPPKEELVLCNLRGRTFLKVIIRR